MTTKKIIQYLLGYLDKIPIKDRKTIDGIEFIVVQDAIKIGYGGCFVRGMYYPDNSIVFYAPLIHSQAELAEVFLHELAHHAGMDEKQVGRYINTKFK